jgi:asparagine synthase (glutamine-hydrolysing)
MCGIAGICSLTSDRDIRLDDVARMMGAIRYRGPDEAGVYLDDCVGLGHVRLSIIDLASGGQPISNEDHTLWIVYNGEVFNYIELREELVAKGHQFSTSSDTEVVLHLYEQEGPECLQRLNGQFAFAIWDSRRQALFLARDRVGIRPLHYTVHGGTLAFASEVKSLFAIPGVPRRLSAQALDQIFTCWTVLPGQTAFEGIYELPPGHYLTVSKGTIKTKRYWDVPICNRGEQLDRSIDSITETVQDLLEDAIRIRLRADVPVGCYLSGGLDSSGIAAITARRFNADLSTFGIRFEEDAFDEGSHQEIMAAFLGTRHREVWASGPQIGAAFRKTLWHGEKPLLRTAPVPLLMLSKAVRQSGLKVVLTGEGADEIFGGYNIFKEAKVRQFWARQPDSQARAALTGRLYGYVFRDQRARHFLKSFFASGLDRCDDPLFSHRLRWQNTSRIKAFFSEELKAAIGESDIYEQIRGSLPDGYNQMDTVAKAQYLETKIFLSNYLLSSQGDRMAMANSVEIRLPFLDYRIIEFMAKVPSRWKVLGLSEKHILKRALAPVVPERVCRRHKQPYRAPIVSGLLGDGNRDRMMEMLSRKAIESAGLFDADRVEKLLNKAQAASSLREIDSMALAGILSSQIIQRQFVEDFSIESIPVVRPDVVIDKRVGARQGISEMSSSRRQDARMPNVLRK